MTAIEIALYAVGIIAWFIVADMVRRDAYRRGRDGGVWGLMSLFIGPVAWLVWLRERGRATR